VHIHSRSRCARLQYRHPMPLDPRVRALINQGMPALCALRKVGRLPPKTIEECFVVEPKPPTTSSPKVEPPAKAPSTTVLH
jgi:hypothetical protein